MMSISVGILSAQEFLYKTIDVSDGLPSNEAYRVYQTSDGFYWLLTDSGLVKYDGNEMKVFDVSSGLPNDDVFKVHEDECGRLWVMSTSTDLCYIRNGEVVVLKTDGKLKPYIFLSDENKVSFFNFEQILNVSCKKDSITKIQSFFDDKRVLQISKSLRFISEGSNVDKLVYKIENNQINREETIKRVLPSYSAAIAHGLDCIIVPREELTGEYLVLNVKLGTFKIDTLKDFIPTDIPLIVQYNKLRKEFSFHARENVFVHDSLLNQSESYSVPSSYNESIKFNFKDRSGYWITGYRGFAYISNIKERTDFQIEEQFSNKSILQLEFADGSLFGADTKGKIFSRRLIHDEMVFDNHLSQRRALYNIISANKSIYTSSRNDYVERWDFSGKKIDNEVDKRFKLRLKKMAKGERCFCGIRDQLQQFDKDLKILFSSSIGSWTDVEYDSGNKMFWLSQSDAIISYKECKNEIDTIANIAGVREMFVLPNGMLLNTNDKKIYNCLDTNCKEVGNIRLKIQSVVNANGTILLSTAKDIYEFDLKTQKLEKVYHAYASKSTQTINDLAYNEGKLYVATTEGVFSCYSDSLRVYSQDMTAIITSPNEDTTIQMKYEDNNIAIGYTCITLENHDNLHFEYILKPVQNKITYTTFKSINFAELAPHNYTFEVTAVNELGNRSNTAILKFEVKSPWYMTWWFYSLLALGALLLLYSLFLFYKRRLDKKAALDQKFAELELNALQSQMNPHFIFNTLNSIQNLIGNKRNKEADRYLSKFARLMRKFLELSKSKFITLEEELAITKEYLELEKLRFGEKLSFEFTTAEELQNLDIMVPATLIQPFVENALIHGLFHKKGNGMVKIAIKSQDSDLVISIEDNGIGLEAAHAKKKKRKIGHISRGSELITQRLEVLKKLQNYNVQISMSDLKTVDREGSAVEIVIPNFKENYTAI